jgi:diguanylate cyclase (GGDEF)-like protein
VSLRILIADDEEDIRAFLEITLGLAGFEVLQARDGVEALELARSERPDVVVLDVMMPRLDGLETLRRLRDDARTEHLPVLLLTARALKTHAVEGLDAGADDYLAKPFDADELLARIRAAVRRADQQRSRNPLSGLPGNESILAELAERIDTETPFALLYVDLDQFKPFNDHYGFLRGDEALRALSDLLQEVRAELDDPSAFLGHVGGDDFVLIVDPERAEETAQWICDRFDERSPAFYDDRDRAMGYIEVADRRGIPQRFGMLSLSIGIASSDRRDFAHQGEAVATATEMKRYAKARGEGGSCYAIDRRADEAEQGVEVEIDLPN